MILAGDIGGTHARLSYYRQNSAHADPDSNSNSNSSSNPIFTAVHENVYASREFRGLDEIVLKFISETGVSPSSATFGIAGPVRNGRVETSNLPWIVEAPRLAQELHLDSVNLINDLEAQAWGIQCLGPDDTVALNHFNSPQTPHQTVSSANQHADGGNQAVIAAGTGLGEAGLIWDGDHHHIFACEGGHCDFAPRNELEIELLRYLLTRFGHVSYERIVSGPGLVNVYLFLKDTHRGNQPEPQWLRNEIAAGDPAAAISQAAVSSSAPLAEQALDLWISIYGAEAGNLALKVLATGGVFLAGGIAPKILPKLASPLFMQAFLSKGRMQPLLETIPVSVITNEKTGLLGAARYSTSHTSANGVPARSIARNN
jgi:glucokinase